jgi:hypothetical protein
MLLLSMRSLTIGAAALLAAPVAAQTYTVTAITAPAFGTLITGATGTTTFLNNGSVTKQSGNGTVYSGPVTRALVTINCANGTGGPTNRCSNVANVALVTVGTSGVTSGRAQAISNFTAVSNSGTVGTGTTNGAALSFQLSGWTATNQTKTFFLDVTLPITGDDVGGTTGAATSGISVKVAKNPTLPTVGLTASATATVRRAMQVQQVTSLLFGTLVRAGSGSGTVTINATTGARTTGGVNPPIPLASGASGRATYTLLGEPSTAYTITVSVPPAMANGANSIPLTLSSTASGSQTMPVGGSLTLGIGATATVPGTAASGTYSSTYSVTIIYN